MTKLPFTYELKTWRGVAFTSVEADIECELSNIGKPSISAVYVEGENLFNGDILHRSLACAIANEAENTPWVLFALEDEAAEEFAERQMRRVMA
jgi:hypothetical protein